MTTVPEYESTDNSLPEQVNSLHTGMWKPWIFRNNFGTYGPDKDELQGQILLTAEIANSHEGDWKAALKLVSSSAAAGCGAVKFQKYFASEMLASGHSMMSTFSSWEWENNIWRELIEAAHNLGLMVFVDVFGINALESLSGLPAVDGVKIHAADVGNWPLLDRLAATNYPIFLGTGGCSPLDIYSALVRLGATDRIVLMHGYQAFPSPLEDTDLWGIKNLQKTFGVAVGLSEHLDADDSFAKVLPLMAVPLGVCCIEKHMILDRSMRGIDSASALNPDEMTELATWIRKAELSIGGSRESDKLSEVEYHRRFKKSMITTLPILTGEEITPDKVDFRILENPDHFSLYPDEAIGRFANKDLQSNMILRAEDLDVKTGLCLVVRLKSQRLPRKALEEISGETAITHLIHRAKLCTDIDRIVLCTSTLAEDKPLIDIARDHGIDTYAGSADQPLERLVACAEMFDWQYVIRATGDNIFLDPDLLSRAVALARQENLDYVSMKTAPVGVHCEVFSTFALRTVQQLSEAPFTTEYLTWFVAENPNFRSMDLPIARELQRSYRLTLDTFEDLQNIKEVVSALKSVGPEYSLKDVISVVEGDTNLENRVLQQLAVSNETDKVKFDFNVGSN